MCDNNLFIKIEILTRTIHTNYYRHLKPDMEIPLIPRVNCILKPYGNILEMI